MWPFAPQKWWRNLPPHRQDRLASLGPLLAVLLFVLAVIAAIAYLRAQESTAERQSLQRDGQYASQRLSMRLSEQQDALQRLARQLALQQPEPEIFSKLVEQTATAIPDLHDISWLDTQGVVVATRGHLDLPGQSAADYQRLLQPAEAALRHQSLQNRQPAYALMPQGRGEEPLLALMVPAYRSGALIGSVYARYTLSSLLYYGVVADVSPRYAVSLVDSQNRQVSGNRAEAKDSTNNTGWAASLLPQGQSHVSALPPVGDALALRLQTFRGSAALRSRLLVGLVLALSALTGWMLIANWLHLRRRQRAQQGLLAETNFRRAMENSLVTGMRALDLQGRITYVNASFCRMTGLREDELVGQTPPFSFWHPDDHQRNLRTLLHTLQQQIPQGGHEMRVQRKDGSVFDARMYMSPLIGADGQHSGWMSSMTDITEPNRIKRQLSASQDRFARVLDAIGTSVSVAPLGGKELLFANHNYRQWFGEDNAAAHVHMVAQAGSLPLDNVHGHPLGAACSSNAEIRLADSQRWVEVRARYLEWTDGRIAQLVVASDITAQREAEERSAQHEQRAQAASRLVTMGEMASSVAHELNQPLTAIHNYCTGMRDRIANGSMQPQELLGALEKTARQAQRAGHIIQRIREFVKRSAPNYSAANVYDMVLEAVELAEIEMRCRNVRLSHQVAPGIAPIMADRILVEQVLVNLMKNAAEAIDNAQMPPARRTVQLQVSQSVAEGKPVVRFAITDAGKGLSEEGLAHLFEAFFTTKVEGLGIGLNLCRSIVESHQGRLLAENLYNDSVSEVIGCRFSFWLPLHATPRAV